MAPRLGLRCHPQTGCQKGDPLAESYDWTKRFPDGPLDQGFDYYFGPLGANDGGTVKFHHNNEPAGETTDMGSLTRMYTDKAIDYLENKRKSDQPFMLYLAHTMMHTNIDASPKFKGTSAGGLYGDVVEEFDFETGRLLDRLDEIGRAHV